ncbi:MAG TPA: DUF488 family protein [Ktedonobacterales bacterium]|nr:DUF488 family protein [Ktedonobacterales bacterium]
MASEAQSVALKRAYETPEASDGVRVLVERPWPGGLSKDRAHLGMWLKDVAPSRELRKWYGHDPARFAEFRRRYEAELAADLARSSLAQLRELAAREHVTLVFAAHDAELSNAAVLRDLLRRAERQ